MGKLMQAIPIDLDKIRNMKLNYASLIRYEKATGRPFNSESFSSMTFSEQATFVWACLVWEDSSLTVDQVSDMLDFVSMQRVQTALSEMTATITALGNSDPNSQSRPS